MISVSISINSQPIYARSAVNIGEAASKDNPDEDDIEGNCKFQLDDGSILIHRRSEGAVKLAIEMLKTIKEPGVTNER